MVMQTRQQSPLGSLPSMLSEEWQGASSMVAVLSMEVKQQALKAAVVVFSRNTTAAI